jgi:hypothetical protein
VTDGPFAGGASGSYTLSDATFDVGFPYNNVDDAAGLYAGAFSLVVLPIARSKAHLGLHRGGYRSGCVVFPFAWPDSASGPGGNFPIIGNADPTVYPTTLQMTSLCPQGAEAPEASGAPPPSAEERWLGGNSDPGPDGGSGGAFGDGGSGLDSNDDGGELSTDDDRTTGKDEDISNTQEESCAGCASAKPGSSAGLVLFAMLLWSWRRRDSKEA